MRAPCKITDCVRPQNAYGLCLAHYQRLRKYGDPYFTQRVIHSGTIEERFWAKVDKGGPEGCWVWTAHIGRNGYGYFGRKLSHRVAYESMIGPVPDGLDLDHLCRVRACCNPQHLEPVTHRENCLRGVSKSAINAAKTTCDHGHPYNERNTYHRKNGQRDCRPCKANRERERQRRIREGSAA